MGRGLEASGWAEEGLQSHGHHGDTWPPFKQGCSGVFLQGPRNRMPVTGTLLGSARLTPTSASAARSCLSTTSAFSVLLVAASLPGEHSQCSCGSGEVTDERARGGPGAEGSGTHALARSPAASHGRARPWLCTPGARVAPLPSPAPSVSGPTTGADTELHYQVQGRR